MFSLGQVIEVKRLSLPRVVHCAVCLRGIRVWLNIKQQGQTAGFGPCFHLPGLRHFGITPFLTHSQLWVSRCSSGIQAPPDWWLGGLVVKGRRHFGFRPQKATSQHQGTTHHVVLGSPFGFPTKPQATPLDQRVALQEILQENSLFRVF